MTLCSIPMEISAEQAEHMLALNTSNRPLSRFNVETLKAKLRGGQWKLNGETIVFSREGCLLQGQHRLTACVETGIPIQTFVVFGIDPDAFDTMDEGKRRTGADVLSIDGQQNTSKLAAAARGFCKLNPEIKNSSLSFTNATILEVCKRNPELSKWTTRFVQFKPSSIPSLIVGVTAAIEILHGESLALEFFDKSVGGIGLQQSDPEYWLRKRLEREDASKINSIKETVSSDYAFQLTVKAANKRIKGECVSTLRVGQNEDRPVLIGANRLKLIGRLSGFSPA